MQQTAPLSPEHFWETITGFQRSAALKAAVELEIFTRINAGFSSNELVPLARLPQHLVVSTK
jgi:hypothetical protein